MIVNLCSQCGAECLRKRQFRGTRYFCSDKCKYTLYNGIKSQKRALEKIVYTKTCLMCSSVFTYDRDDKLYCSKKCYWKSSRDNHPDSGNSAECVVCYTAFVKYQGIQKCCTVKCSKKYEKVKAKQKVYDYYGRKCNCSGCSETAPIFLTIDHVNNDGHLDRGTNFRGGDGLYRKVIRENFPDTYQVLCHNCNWAKQYGECPHNK